MDRGRLLAKAWLAFVAVCAVIGSGWVIWASGQAVRVLGTLLLLIVLLLAIYATLAALTKLWPGDGMD